MSIDAAYHLTRTKGKAGTVTQLTGDGTFNPETFATVPAETVHTVRWLYKEPTSYSRLIRANATKQRIGQTTFIMWAKDVSFTRLDPDDFITQDGIDYQVRTSVIESETSFVVTADEVV